MNKQYIYIVQASLEPSKCKIGKTNDLERRLKEYNNMTGKSKENIYNYLFCCEVKDMSALENEIKKKFSALREEKSKEIYFYNSPLFEDYIKFIKSNKLFIKEIYLKTEDKIQKVKIVKKTTPTLKERGLSRKDILQKAQKVNNDEFYTRIEDIEKELSMYDKRIWKNKTVFCNCDDAVDNDERNTSAFALYFLRNFIELKLKKLICTHYDGPVDLFNQGSKAYVFTKDGFSEKKDFPKNYSGSFDDPLSLKILKEEADIVCTNPPFSRAIDYWKILISSGKKFIIISNFTNVLTPAYIPYFQNNQVWAGYNRVDYFLTPKKQLTMASGHWYTNFKIKNRPKYKNLKIMPLKDIPEKYKRYDDSKILLVNNNYIPNDYKKPFAVSAYPMLSGVLEKGYKIFSDKEYFPYINKKRCFGRILLQKIL
ncbi:adenine-specific methyltransferase EcoRI family protein [Brachyspira catarrhinii]|uniref:DNA methyltransferase n=1 Tax=Brachyspira catarrhinii TaxID=2528966 RepID=A0ABY2TU58_9SPIR|nr:adenine-specific methyltransferase EcoRI family protein [Brachyspira catarrhinii]TKZ35726.1 DNA methyltransferase [Brachyspira catarrhinii]